MLACAGASAVADHQLTASDYLSFQLFALLNPALKSARSLCAASRFQRVQQEVCRQPVKLTSFSEMQHVCDPDICWPGCRHWLAESPAGMTIQICCALIASVLLVLWTGRKPTLRQWETLQLYWLGWVSLEELTAILTPKKKSA